MKKFLISAVTVLIFATVPNAVHAQSAAKAGNTPVAHLNVDSLLDIMPAFKIASDSAQLFYSQLEQTMYAMNVELQRKSNEYDSLKNKISPSILKLKEQELYDLQQRIQNFQQSAQDDYSNYRAKLLVPIFESIQKAVKEVALAKGYHFVIDSSKSATVVLYASPTDDIFTDVRLKLKIPEPTKPAPKAPGGTPAPAPGH
ncbi:hypothetical protein BH09BAC5_BH09BAC5_11210 [soil metagenome]